MKSLAKLSILGLIAAAGACQKDAPTIPPAPEPSQGVGNGFPGSHDFLLNIIGVSKDKTAEMDDNSGKRIFVQLYGGQKVCVTDEDWATYQELLGVEELTDNPYACTEEEWVDALQGGRGKVTGGWDALDKTNKILLTPNSTGLMAVLDANATDADGAELTLPDDLYGHYKVFARALGKPGGNSAMTLCANETEETSDDIDGDEILDIETWCNINQSVMTRIKGRPTTEDVTDKLFTLTVLVDVADVKDVALTACLAEEEVIDLEATGAQIADVPIFHSCLEGSFWNYDNNGLKLLQLRFFRVEDPA